MSPEKAKMLEWVPEWVCDLLADFRKNGKTGALELNFNDGGIRNACFKTVHHPPKEKG